MDGRRLMAMIAVLASILVPASADAANGGFLAPGGCLGVDPACQDALPDGFDALSGAVTAVASNDGTSAYALSWCCLSSQEVHQNAVVRMRRDVDGSLAFLGCLADPAGGGCGQLPPTAYPNSIAAADSDVYVGSRGDVAHLRPSGDSLAVADCVGATAGCHRLPTGNDALAGDVHRLLLSPDRTRLFALVDGGVVTLARNGTGSLSYVS